MIDVTRITKYNRTKAELQEFLIFCIFVAGKKAEFAAKKVEEFLSPMFADSKKALPFDYIADLGDKAFENLTTLKIGQPTRISSALRALVSADYGNKLVTITTDQLESIPGIGPKTSRFFCLHSQKHAQFAVLDTHILKFLRSKGHKAPKSTPGNKTTYSKLEKTFLALCEEAKKTPAAYDLEIWKTYAVTT
jgi:hypothetical protein